MACMHYRYILLIFANIKTEMTSFQKPIGAKSDLSELEYITALHQTCFPDLRKDCTISAVDVLHFLRSRYGLKLDQNRSLDIILGLGGQMPEKELSSAGDIYESENKALEQLKKPEYVENGHRTFSDRCSIDTSSSISSPLEGNSEEYLDIVQALSVLLVPMFIKASQDSIEDTDKLNFEVMRVQQAINSKGDGVNILDTLEIMWKQHQLKNELNSLKKKQSLLVDHSLIEYIRQALVDSIQEDQSQPILLSEHFVKSLLREYGEDLSASDSELVAQMVECATPPGNSLNGSFNADAFTAALTSDVLSWESGVEDKVSTPFFDVYGYDPLCHSNELFDESCDKNEHHTSIAKDQQGDDLVVIEEQESDRVPPRSNTKSLVWRPMNVSVICIEQGNWGQEAPVVHQLYI